MLPEKTCLMIVDMQRYYLDGNSPFYLFATAREKTAMNYISKRCSNLVVPHIARLIELARSSGAMVVYLRLCGFKQDRSDLHYFFYEANREAEIAGYSSIYPLANEELAEIIPELKPLPGELVITKQGFSGFAGTDLAARLRKLQVQNILLTGLATSQCVESTARSASDEGFRVFHIHDAMADYDIDSHNASLFASVGVCGGNLVKTEDVLASIKSEMKPGVTY